MPGRPMSIVLGAADRRRAYSPSADVVAKPGDDVVAQNATQFGLRQGPPEILP